jgi:hypothetical protein
LPRNAALGPERRPADLPGPGGARQRATDAEEPGDPDGRYRLPRREPARRTTMTPGSRESGRQGHATGSASSRISTGWSLANAWSRAPPGQRRRLSGGLLSGPDAMPVHGRPLTWYVHAMTGATPAGDAGVRAVFDAASGKVL